MEEELTKNDKPKKIPNRILFNSRTFNSKLFLKLTSSIIKPSIICIQTLRYESENRKPFEIESAIPWLQTITDLMKFINMEETPESSKKLLIELTWFLFYKYYKKNKILKKPAENQEFFYILLQGKILRLNIVFERISLTLEEYLLYLFKMKLTNEKEILRKCRLLNSFYADIDGDNLYKFCLDNPQYNFEELKEKAKNEIISLGFKIENFNDDRKTVINSIDNYLKIATIKKNIKSINDGIHASPKFYIGRYEKAGYIMKGQVIGNLINEKYNDDSEYICIDNCDIAQLNKNNSKLENLYNLIIEKKRKSLSKLKNNLLIFNLLNEKFFYNEVIPHFEYKQFHQGEKIFIQGSIYRGVYLVTDGEVNIYLNTSINEIGNYILNITNSLNDFKEYASNLNKIGYSKETSESAKPKIMKDKTNLDKEKVDSLNKNKKFEVLNVSQYSIFGTNELYDGKTGLYYFSAECASKEAIIYFLPHKYFYSLLIREKPIYLSLAEMIEFRAKDIIGRLKYHVKCFDNVMDKTIKRFIESNNTNNLNNKNLSYNNYITSLKHLNIKKINKKIALKIRSEKPYEFPPLVKDKKDRSIKEYNNKTNKTSYIANETIGSFSFKNKNNISLRDKVFNQYKKIKLMSLNPNPNNISLNNRKIKINDRRINLSERVNKIKNFKIHLPNNFPFKIQNSFYDSNPIKIDKRCISKSPFFLKYKQ